MNKKSRIIRKKRELNYNLINELLIDKWQMTATNIFEWKNLPDELTSSRLERLLYSNNRLAFFYDDLLGYLVLPIAQKGGLNVYGEVVHYSAVGVQGYNKDLTVDDSVLIYSNTTQKSPKQFIDYYCGKLANIEQATDVNLNSCKTPLIFEGDKDDMLTLKNYYSQLTGNEPVIYTNKKSIHEKSLNVHNSQVEFLGLKFHELYKAYENKILNYLGLKYINTDKKERLVVSETKEHNEYTNSNLDSFLNARQEACEKINKMFDLNISVDINEKLKEDDENGEIYNDDSRIDE